MTALHLARPADLDRVTALIAACQAEQGHEIDDQTRAAAIVPLLEGLPQGCVYLIGPARAPLGCAVLSFGWSLTLGGLTGRLELLYIRPAIRKRGIASQVLIDLPKALADAGLMALDIALDQDNDQAQRLAARSRFQEQNQTRLWVKPL